MNISVPMTARALFAQARHAPLVSARQLTGGAPLLVLAPHPDDESLGCGGLIALCRHAGIEVSVALLTDGAGSHPGSRTHPPSALARLRAAEMRAALGELGVEAGALHEMHCPDGDAPVWGSGFDDLVASIGAIVCKAGARTIAAPWRLDPHCDHEAAAMIAASAARAQGLRHIAYPVWGRLLDMHSPAVSGPILRLDVRPVLDAKRRAILCHQSQLGGVIADSAEAFALPQALLDACLEDHEIYFDENAA